MNYSIGLDYLSFKLLPQFNATDFRLWAERDVLFDNTTGELCKNARPDQFGIDFRGGNVVVRTYNGSQVRAYDLVNDWSLPITRIDLALDFYGQGFIFAEGLVEKVLESYRARRITCTQAYWKSPNQLGEMTYTWLFGARKSDFQLRIYTKKDFVRVEFQIRGKLARYTTASASDLHKYHCRLLEQYWVTCPDCLEAAFRAIESRKLVDNLFLPDGARVPLPKLLDNNKSNRQLWIETQVLKACVNEYNETGINLPLTLVELFNRKVGVQNVGNITRFPNS
jgi:hypothetical protein